MHLHAEGLRGTGKTTVIRAAAQLLPPIRRIAGCPYNCDPLRPHCPLHRDLPPEDPVRLRVETVPAPFLEISPSAKIGTVVGSIDLARLTDPGRPEAALLPGTLARAHRGVVFVDEINRLADTGPELADALLDVMGTKPGRLQIEETGLPPVVIPCRTTVWAASNPDEEPGPLADIRRQLADRFDLGVAMRRPAEPQSVTAVLCRDDFALPAGRPRVEEVSGLPVAAPVPPLPPELRDLLARLYCDFQIESLRAVQAWQAAARLLALRAGRPAAEYADLVQTAPFALRHRLEPEELARLLQELERGQGPAEPPAALAGASAQMPPPPPPAGGAAAGARAGRRPFWQRLTRVERSAAAAGPAGAEGAEGGEGLRLGDPGAMPVITPRRPARFLTDLPPDALLLPARPARGEER